MTELTKYRAVGTAWLLGLMLALTLSVSGNSQDKRKNPEKMTPESITQGKLIFKEFCAGCHGLRADGRGPQALNLLPRPQNLRNTSFVNYLDDERLYSSISGGVRGTSMPAFEMSISPKNRWHLINYIKSLTADIELDVKNSPKTLDIIPEKLADVTDKDINEGKRLFAKFCASCHGENANGKGEVSRNLVPRPRNLVYITSYGAKPFINYLQDARLFDSIANGVAGTSMSPWNAILSQKQIWQIIFFLRKEAGKNQTDYDQSFEE